MKELEVVRNDRYRLNPLMEDGVLYFLGVEVASILGFKDPSRAVRQHVPNDDKRIVKLEKAGQNRQFTAINEAGVYRLIFQAKTEEAKAFQNWVTREVLPSIRRYGVYATNSAIEQNEELNKAIEKIKQAEEKVAKLQEKLEEQEPECIFAKAFEVSSGCCTVGELARHLKANGIDIGRNRLFAELREEGYLLEQGCEKNNPSQRALQLKLFVLEKQIIVNMDKKRKSQISKKTLVTPKGQKYFIKKYLKRKVA